MANAYETPELMMANTQSLWKGAVSKRDSYARFVEASGLKDIIENAISTQPIDSGVYFVGGSRSWEQWSARSKPKEGLLNDVERSSMTAGNFDAFYACDNLPACKTLVCELNTMAQVIQDRGNALLKSYKVERYTINVEQAGFSVTSTGKCAAKAPFAQVMKWPAYSIMLTLKSPRTKGAYAPFHDKLLLYIEVFFLHPVEQ
jgi:hypothetical protein